jgi:hypothetical protein
MWTTKRKQGMTLTLEISFVVDDGFVAGVHPQCAFLVDLRDFPRLFLIIPVPAVMYQQEQ